MNKFFVTQIMFYLFLISCSDMLTLPQYRDLKYSYDIPSIDIKLASISKKRISFISGANSGQSLTIKTKAENFRNGTCDAVITFTAPLECKVAIKSENGSYYSFDLPKGTFTSTTNVLCKRTVVNIKGKVNNIKVNLDYVSPIDAFISVDNGVTWKKANATSIEDPDTPVDPDTPNISDENGNFPLTLIPNSERKNYENIWSIVQNAYAYAPPSFNKDSKGKLIETSGNCTYYYGTFQPAIGAIINGKDLLVFTYGTHGSYSIEFNVIITDSKTNFYRTKNVVYLRSSDSALTSTNIDFTSGDSRIQLKNNEINLSDLKNSGGYNIYLNLIRINGAESSIQENPSIIKVNKEL